MTWQMPTYDPELNLLYITRESAARESRTSNRAATTLYTGCVVALNADTGKMVVVFPASAA
jgi:glucose dehydrogenase